MTLHVNELHTQIQHRLIEKLSESERRYRELVESLREIVFKCDQTGNFTFLNQAWTATLGYDTATSLNCPWISFLHPDDRDRGLQLIDQLHHQQGVIGQEFRFQHQNGAIVWLELSMHPNGADAQTGSLTNITDRKNAEQALHETNEALEIRVEQRTAELQQAMHDLQKTHAQLVQAEKMSSLGQLVAGIAHEINNPVSFVYGNLVYANTYVNHLLRAIALYQQHTADLPAVAQAELEVMDLEFVIADLPKLLCSMKVGADRIRQIVLSLRNFSRLDEAEFKTVDIHAGIDNTLMILQHRLKQHSHRAGIEVIKQYGNLPWVECYPGQLNQVFMDILANAIDALLEQASRKPPLNAWQPTISIRTELKTANASFPQDSVVVRIQDNGIGMPEALSRRIFEPFFTTKPVGQGAGMGLSISYQVVTQLHSGTLQCQSEPGQGTEFLIQIPLAQSQANSVEV